VEKKTMALESLRKIFPLIDDPANIFYSKIKQWFQIQSNFHLHCKATSRVDRVVEAKFNGISRPYNCKFRTHEFLKEEDIGHYLYIQYTFLIYNKTNQEITTSGESIPVDIWDMFITELDPIPKVLHDQDNVVIIEPNGSLYYNVYIRVNKVFRNSSSQLDILGTEIDYDELHYEDAYRMSVGRLWVIKPPVSDTTKQYCYLDTLLSWELYNIDSDNHYTLIDKSNTPPDDFGATHMWPFQYGPGIDHEAKFYCNQSIGRHPYVTLPNNTFWIEVREGEWLSPKMSYYFFARVTDKAFPFLNTRGLVPYYLYYLFLGLVFSKTNSNICAESIFLLYLYICNMNPRYLLCKVHGGVGSPLDVVFKDFGPYTDPKSILQYGRSISWFIGNCIDTEFRFNFTVKYKKKEMYDVHPLKDEMDKALINLAYHQTYSDNMQMNYSANSLPTQEFPHFKWYIKQALYILSFWKYKTYFKQMLCNSNGTKLIQDAKEYPLLLPQYFGLSSSLFKEIQFTIDLNGQWISADPIEDSSIIESAGAGYHVVKSNSNYHVPSSQSIMYINILTNDSITFKCMTRSEANYDYPTVTMDGVEIFNGKSKTSFTSFTVSDAKGKKLVVTYKKDSSQNNDLDRAFLAYL
jgi:hypothetical protein